MRPAATAHCATARRTPAENPRLNAPSTVKNPPNASSAVATYGQPTAHPAMTCADGIRISRTAKDRLEPNDQPRLLRPRKLTRERAPSSSEAAKRIHCRFCTEVVWP